MKNVEILTLKKDGITDFAEERNNLLSKTTKDWVMFVDTDEIITPDLSREIENLDFKKNGYYIKRKNLFLGKVSGEDKVLRLGKKNAGKWERSVHETWEIKGSVGTLKNYLIHDTAKTLREAISKTDFYSTLHAKENLKEGKRSSILKIIFYPKIRFISSLLSGYGFAFAMLHSFHSFLSWSKLYQWQKYSH